MNRSRNKLVQFQNLVGLLQPSIMGVTETWLGPQVDDIELLPFSDYQILRRDRFSMNPCKRGGGVLLALSPNLNAQRLSELEPLSSEILVCTISPMFHSKIVIILCYRAPNHDINVFSSDLKFTLENVS